MMPVEVSGPSTSIFLGLSVEIEMIDFQDVPNFAMMMIVYEFAVDKGR